MKKEIAAIGAGAWGINLVRTLHSLGVLACVVETSASLREKIESEFPDLLILSEIDQLFSQDGIKAVTIATPAVTHHDIARRCLLAGFDVFVEKPMTMNSVEAEDLVALAESGGRILMVGHLLLYKPAVEFIRNYLRDGRLGRVFTLHQERMKLGRARSVENALWSLGVHDVAALLFFVGSEPTKVQFSGHCGLQDSIADDTYLHLTFSNGSVAHLHNSWLWPEDRRGLKVIGDRGMLVYDEKAESVTLVKKTIDGSLYNQDDGSELLFQTPTGDQPLRTELQHFLDSILARTKPLSSGESGVEVIRVLEQCLV